MYFRWRLYTNSSKFWAILFFKYVDGLKPIIVRTQYIYKSFNWIWWKYFIFRNKNKEHVSIFMINWDYMFGILSRLWFCLQLIGWFLWEIKIIKAYISMFVIHLISFDYILFKTHEELRNWHENILENPLPHTCTFSRGFQINSFGILSFFAAQNNSVNLLKWTKRALF